MPPVARALVASIPAVAGLLLAAPGLWGVQGAFDPVRYPDDWERVRRQVAAAPGPVLALPWFRYFDLDIAGGRRVLNPAPYYLGGDVLVSPDPELPGGERETADPRHGEVEEVVAGLRSGGGRASARLADLGIRWVVLLRDVDWRAYRLESDEGLREVEGGQTIALYEVVDWSGPLRTPGGHTRAVFCPLPVLCRLGGSDDPESGGVLVRPYAWGWARGESWAGPASGGVLAVPPGGSPWLVYLPGLAIIVVDAFVVGIVTLRAASSLHRWRKAKMAAQEA
jgi:hypothetical protein